MARGISLELRCGMCHSTSPFPATGLGRGDFLGEIYVSPNRTWMTWSGPYRAGRDELRNRLPGPRQVQADGPGTTWRPVPRAGVQHECRTGAHRMALTEAQLWDLVRKLPSDATVLFLPPTQGATVNGADVARAMAVANQRPNEPRLPTQRRRFSASVVTVTAPTNIVGRGKLQGTG